MSSPPVGERLRIRAESDLITGVYSSRTSGSPPDLMRISLQAHFTQMVPRKKYIIFTTHSALVVESCSTHMQCCTQPDTLI